MAQIKGICHGVAMRPDPSNAWMVIMDFKCCGLDPANPIQPANMSLGNVDPSTGTAAIAALLATQGQAYLTSQGYTFGVGDSVFVFGVA